MCLDSLVIGVMLRTKQTRELKIFITRHLMFLIVLFPMKSTNFEMFITWYLKKIYRTIPLPSLSPPPHLGVSRAPPCLNRAPLSQQGVGRGDGVGGSLLNCYIFFTNFMDIPMIAIKVLNCVFSLIMVELQGLMVYIRLGRGRGLMFSI